jgi:holin-like protein
MIDMQKQTGSGAKPVPYLSVIESRAMTLAELAGKNGVRRFCVDLPIGLTVLTLCLLTGEELRVWLHLIIPGNLLGLFVLLLCFHLRVIPVQLI